MTNDYWLEAKNITCFKNEYEVVKDLNLKLRYNENVILIGPNGSGKSSLLELINRNDVSLGLAPFDILGFKSEEELNLEISKLIKTRSEFKTKTKVISN